MKKLPHSFYRQKDVVSIAKQLLGKVLYTNIDGQITAGIITETEAYEGAIDKASHAYNNRRTQRTEVMYNKGGCSYVFLCYGVHNLFNVVTHEKDTPHAVLIRAIKPYKGIEIINQRRGLKPDQKLLNKNFSGPGKVTQALAIDRTHNTADLRGNTIWIADEGISFLPEEIKATPRIGIDYAEEHKHWPYRFVVNW